MGTGDILLGGNPTMDKYPVQGGVTILLSLLHATETGISSGRVGLWLMYAFTLRTLLAYSLAYQAISEFQKLSRSKRG